METFFYVVGIALVLLALAISALGLRSDKLPDRGDAAGRRSASSSWSSARPRTRPSSSPRTSRSIASPRRTRRRPSSQPRRRRPPRMRAKWRRLPRPSRARDPPIRRRAPIRAATRRPAPRSQRRARASSSTRAAAAATASPRWARTPSATSGPNLDEALVDEDADFIRTSIVDPGAEVAEGFGDGIMPDHLRHRYRRARPGRARRLSGRGRRRQGAARATATRRSAAAPVAATLEPR